MARTVKEVMTHDPVVLPSTAPAAQAAQAMRDHDIGDVLVMDDGSLRGIVTDRDIVVRAVAEGKDLGQVRLSDITSASLATVSPKDTVADVIKMMRKKSLRRVPVVQDDRPVGIVSLGDLAIEYDPESALGDISAAPGNR